jgi:hypothetical protein
MKGVKGRDVFISKANLSTEETTALSYRIRAQMMAGYHANVAPAERILNIDGVLVLQKKDGALILPAPADFIFWTKILEDRVKAFESRINKKMGVSAKELWITGRIDQTALEKFKARNWRVTENANKILFK